MLFLIPSLIAFSVAAGLVVQVRDYQASQRKEQAQFQAAQRRAQVQREREGQAIENKICRTFAALAKRKPPPGNPHTNPSRAYLQGQYITLNQLGPDLGCPEQKDNSGDLNFRNPNQGRNEENPHL